MMNSRARRADRNPGLGLSKEAGISLIIVMLAVLVLTVLTATIVFVANSETLASHNYKLNTQADYLAKAGIQQTVNWLRSNRYQAVSQAQALTYYNVSGDGGIMNLYTSQTQPVRCISGCASLNSTVQLIGYGSGSSNYPSITNTGGTAVATAFVNDLVNVRVTADPNNSGTFSVNAYLLNYQTVNSGTAPALSVKPVETWLIKSQGTWTGTQGSSTVVAQAEEEALVQPVYSPTFGSALYGYCSVSMHGSSGVCTDSFNSAYGAYGGGNPGVLSGHCDTNSTNVIDSGAGVGANGGVTVDSNVTVSGNVTIGNTPTQPCSASGYSGNTSSVLGQVVTGPHKNPPAVPTFPAGFPTGAPSYSNSVTVPQVSQSNSSSPSSGTISPGNSTYAWPCSSTPPPGGCNGSQANPYLISSASMGGAGDTLTLYGGADLLHPVYYDIDSLTESGNGQITISGYVVLNVQTTLSITGNGVANSANSSNPPECLQINFAGTSASLGGNGGLSAVVVAPNANVKLGGGGSGGYLVGSIQADNIDDVGGYPVHFDLQLNRLGGVLGVPSITVYSRKKM